MLEPLASRKSGAVNHSRDSIAMFRKVCLSLLFRISVSWITQVDENLFSCLLNTSTSPELTLIC